MLTLNNILAARDFSDLSDRALRHGLDLAARTGATLHVLHAEVLHGNESRSSDPPSPTRHMDTFRQDLKETGTASAEALDNVTVKEIVERDVSPAPALLNYASEANIDLIALGTHGRSGPSRILLGSVAEEVVRKAPHPVLTMRGPDDGERTPPPGNIDRILVPVDFSDYSREALRLANEWAKLYEAHVDVLHVVEDDLHPAFYVGGTTSVYDVEPNLDEKVRTKLDEFVSESISTSAPTEMHVATGSPSSAIAEFVDEHPIDLCALSTHGRTGLQRFFLGSVAEKVVRHVRCPVLTSKAFGRSIVSPDSAQTA